jgi:hypothetical protein
MAKKRAMATVMRVAVNEEGSGNSGKSNGNGLKGDGQATALRAMAMMVVGEQWQQGRWQQ